MKKLLYLFLLLPVFVMGQQGIENSITTTTYNDSLVYSETPVAIPIDPAPGSAYARMDGTFFDGLGRPYGIAASRQSASGRNIVRPIVYDALGRQAKQYLPYVSLDNSNGFTGSEEALMDYYGIPQEWENGNPSSEATSNPYTETIYEPSPLNRVLEQGAPGNSWAVNPNSNADHTIKYDYQLNTAVNTNDKVKLFKAVAVWDANYNYYGITLTNATGTTYYVADKLTRTIMKDENWTAGNNNTIEVYRNGEGQVVLKRAFNGSAAVPHDTYYVYDQFGNLSFVIPPMATGSVTDVVLSGLCYQYRYDDRNRLVEKKLPGKQWEFIVYDVLGRIVASGPSFSPFRNLTTIGWLITKYDAFNRPVVTGWVPVGAPTPLPITSATRKALQAERDMQLTNLNETKATANTTVNGVAFRYTTVAYPTSGYHVLTVNYFDNYDYTGAPTDFTTLVEGQKIYYNNSTRKPRGLPTGSWIRITENTTTFRYELNSIQYDYQGRPIRTRMLNHLGGYTQIDTKLAFSGRIDYTIKTHRRTASTLELYIKDNFTYTDRDRLLRHTHQIGVNGTPQLLAYNTYDELGQLINRKTGGTDQTAATYFQKTDFTYNVRGWLKGINDVNNLTDGPRQDLFAFKINYNTTEGTAVAGVAPLYNGNISETYWRSASDDILRKYGYGYDQMNRLVSAAYQRPGASPTPVWHSYDEQLSYDRNGNITLLYRTGGVDSPNFHGIDDLSFTYETSSNKLLTVSDNEGSVDGFKDDAVDPVDDATDYQYDLNGNITADQNKKILSITYNHLNLPVLITFDIPGNNIILYTYDALGKRINKSVAITNSSGSASVTTDYLTGFQYLGSSLKFFPTAQGYVNVVNETYNYVFNFTDHLGNVRLSYGADPANPGTLKILEENHYYPYGLKHQNYNATKLEYDSAGTALIPVTDTKYKYKFNGQELQEENGVNMTAMDFRQYDNAIGRFVGIDVLSETEFSITPYHFGGDNPVYFTDPSGMKTAPWIDHSPNQQIEGPDWIQSMWASTTTHSSWTNEGGGAFYNNDSPQGIDMLTGELFPTMIGVGLNNVDVVAGQNSTWLDAAQAAVYSTSYYNSNSRNVNVMTAGYFTGDPMDSWQVSNVGIGIMGLGLSKSQVLLLAEQKFLESRGTITALNKITQEVAPSLTNVSKISRGLGFVGVGLTILKVGHDFKDGKDFTASQAFDIALSVTLAVATISNPIALIGFGIYGILDATGTLDTIKEALGGNTVIYKSPY